jgi:Family of unknown function (DUF6390)
LKDKGVLLHAKHAFMPNSLGYCGPDDRGVILRHLEESRSGEDLVSTLRGFEAAYPFLRLIARSTGREVFDYSVPEAYWIGNGLLDRVHVADFHSFSHRELAGKDPAGLKGAFRAAGVQARPHHTFYVMSTFAGSTAKGGANLENAGEKKVASMIDSCRVSWGEVREVRRGTLRVEYSPVTLGEGGISLAKPRVKEVKYNPEVSTFKGVKRGDAVSLHWDYACEVLSRTQLANLKKYTLVDMRATNALLRSR